jgi:hypothetical protein
MRTLTTDWNNVAYASATTYCDRYAGTYVTIPANTPVDVRSMSDSVIGNDYYVLTRIPDTLAVDSAGNAETVAVDATVDVVVTVTDNPLAVLGVRVTATSQDPTKVSVDAPHKITDSNGQCTFTLTGVAAHAGRNVTFQVASDTTLEQVVAVTITA